MPGFRAGTGGVPFLTHDAGTTKARSVLEVNSSAFLQKNPQIEKLLYTRQETAAALGVSVRTLGMLTDRGVIPRVRLPGSRLVMYSPDAVRAALAKLQVSNGDGS